MAQTDGSYATDKAYDATEHELKTYNTTWSMIMRSLTKQETTAVSGGIFDVRALERNQGFGGNPFINQPWDMMDRMSLQGGDGGSGGGSGSEKKKGDSGLDKASGILRDANEFCKNNPNGTVDIKGVTDGAAGGIGSGKFGGGGVAGGDGVDISVNCNDSLF